MRRSLPSGVPLNTRFTMTLPDRGLLQVPLGRDITAAAIGSNVVFPQSISPFRAATTVSKVLPQAISPFGASKVLPQVISPFAKTEPFWESNSLELYYSMDPSSTVAVLTQSNDVGAITLQSVSSKLYSESGGENLKPDEMAQVGVVTSSYILDDTNKLEPGSKKIISYCDMNGENKGTIELDVEGTTMEKAEKYNKYQTGDAIIEYEDVLILSKTGCFDLDGLKVSIDFTEQMRKVTITTIS